MKISYQEETFMLQKNLTNPNTADITIEANAH